MSPTSYQLLYPAIFSLYRIPQGLREVKPEKYRKCKLSVTEKNKPALGEGRFSSVLFESAFYNGGIDSILADAGNTVFAAVLGFVAFSGKNNFTVAGFQVKLDACAGLFNYIFPHGVVPLSL